MTREQTLLDFLGLGEAGEDDLGITPSYRENEFSVNGGDYLVLTDSEADAEVASQIKESLWAFNPSFLADVTDIDESVFVAIQQNNQCETNNTAIERLIGRDMDYFIGRAVSADGRGHFLSSYDGNEGEQGEYFIYRTN